MIFPIFKYFNNPANSNSFEKFEGICSCCNQKQGWRYIGPYQCNESISDLCPICIASGDAHNKYAIIFNKGNNPEMSHLSDEIIAELVQRTPSYQARRFEPYETRIFNWITHCDDACVYYGYASIDDLNSVRIEDRAGIFNAKKIAIQYWDWFLSEVPNGLLTDFSSEAHHFRCLHCNKD